MQERINEKDYVCVICPNSCRLSVWKDSEGEVHVKGNQCNRGIDYGVKEYTHPERMLITTMRIEDAKLPIIPVRTERAIPKEQLLAAVKLVNEEVCQAPVKMGQILIENILGTNVNVIASRDMDIYDEKPKICEKFDENDLEEVIYYTLLDNFYNGKVPLSNDEKIHLESVQRQLFTRLKKLGFRNR